MSDIASTIQNVPETFSSWDKCMSQAYCKWPAIAGIIIGSLIVLSIVWCLARCLCCGASCCCSCLRCLDCFTPNRHGRRDRDARYKDDYRPMPNQGFQPMPSPMSYQPNAPQFATFDASSGKIHEDSLPAMPSWQTAQKRRVEEQGQNLDAHGHGDDVEMGRLTQPAQRAPMRGQYSQIPNGPASPTHSSYGYGQSPEYLGAGGHAATNARTYDSDLGAQRLMGSQQLPLRHQSYSSSDHFQNTPSSPAPTYRTNLPDTDRFAPAAVSQNPDQYTREYTHSPPQRQPLQQQQSGYNHPYVPSISTRYEPTEYHAGSQYTNPTRQQAPADNRYPTTSPTGEQRPPSFLRPGRKPVNGSYKEV